jgi:DNA-binding MarR family transcriptional regulator
MTVLFATLGFTPEAVKPVIAWIKDLEEVILFHSKHKKSEKAMREIRNICRGLGVEFESHQVKDEYSLALSMREIKKVGGRYKDKEIIFNVTGGTKMLTSAGLLVCILEGIKAVYVRQKDDKVLEVPLLKMRYEDLLSEREKELLSLISTKCNDKHECELSEIYKEKLSKVKGEGKVADSVITYYLDKLEGRGLIERVEGKDKRSKLIKLKETALFLIE